MFNSVNSLKDSNRKNSNVQKVWLRQVPHMFGRFWKLNYMYSLNQHGEYLLLIKLNNKGVFTRCDAVTVPVKGSSSCQCDGPSDGQNGFHTHFAHQTAHHHWHNDKPWQSRGRNVWTGLNKHDIFGNFSDRELPQIRRKQWLEDRYSFWSNCP